MKDMLQILVNIVRSTAVVLLVCDAAMSAAYFILAARLLDLSDNNQVHTIGKGIYSNYTL
jgi:phage shock protein PspC (stress-responsive transcriptional regulator)